MSETLVLRGLRARLAAWTALIALLTTGLPGLWLTWRAYRGLRQEAFAAQLALARSLAAQIDGQLSQSIAALETVASRPAALNSPERLAQRLAVAAGTAEQLDDLLVADADGSLLGRAAQELAPPAFSSGQRRALAGLALSSRGQTISAVHSEGGHPILRLARSMGRRAAALGQLRLESSGLGDLESLRLGESGFAYLADERGRPLLLPTLGRRLGAGEAGGLAFAFEGRELVREERGPGGGDLLAAAPIESLGWAVAVRRPLAEAEGPARRMRRELFLFTALAVLLGGTLALLLARPLVQALLALAQAARQIEGGSLEPGGLRRLQRGDEVGAVASALAHLAGALREQRAERERAHARALAAEQRLARNERLAALGQLSAGLAHELNNPLMVIRGAAAEAAAGAPPRSRRWLERVQRESERCTRLVRELLDYARPRPPRPRAFDLAELAREAFQAAGTGRPGAYRLGLDMPRPRVRADRDQLQQVLLNLFGNAMDAMPAGGEIGAALMAGAEGWSLQVRDQGPGVPARNREAIFRPFFTAKAQGTGLGLAIARNLMVGHGGSLRCLPTRGRGACFEARWPAHTRSSHA